MKRSLAILSLAAFALVGCEEPSAETADSPVTGDSVTSESSEANVDSDSQAIDKPMTEVASDSADDDAPQGDNNTTIWLSVPEGISIGKAKDYIVVRDMASEKDAHSLANLGFVSQQFAFFIAENGKQDDAYKFLKQAGTNLRAALKGGVKEIPNEVLSQTFYFEAVALGLEGEIEASISSLDDAFNNGFTEVDILKEEDGLEEVRAWEGYEEKLAGWKSIAHEAELAAIRKELSGGEKFPFSLAGKTVAGEEMDLASLKGKVVIVDIWGTWCPPCRAEIPSFIKLQEQYGEQGFQMVGVNFENGETDDEKSKLVTDYIAENGINYPCILGEKEVQEQVPGFRGFPTTLFIDRSGSVRHMAVGMHPYEHLETIVTELLSEDSSEEDSSEN